MKPSDYRKKGLQIAVTFDRVYVIGIVMEKVKKTVTVRLRESDLPIFRRVLKRSGAGVTAIFRAGLRCLDRLRFVKKHDR